MPDLSVKTLSLAVSLGLLGVVCLLAAAVGGGLRIFGVELPVINSVRRQIFLAVFGVVLVVAALVSAHHWTPKPHTPCTPKQCLDWAGTPNFLSHPAGMAVDNSGALYIADHDNNRVLKLAAGTDTPNEMPQFTGWLSWPSGVAVDNSNNVYVADSSHNRVLELAPGPDQTPKPLPFDGLSGPLGVAVDNDHAVYVADTLNRRVVKLAADSTKQEVLPFDAPSLLIPSGVAVDSSFNVYVTDFYADRVYKLFKEPPRRQIELFSYAGLRPDFRS